jgi:hypothetical protein
VNRLGEKEGPTCNVQSGFGREPGTDSSPGALILGYE